MFMLNHCEKQLTDDERDVLNEILRFETCGGQPRLNNLHYRQQVIEQRIFGQTPPWELPIWQKTDE